MRHTLDLNNLTYYAVEISERKDNRTARILAKENSYKRALAKAFMLASEEATRLRFFQERRDMFSEARYGGRVTVRLEIGSRSKDSDLVNLLVEDNPNTWTMFDSVVGTYGVIDDRDLLDGGGYWTSILGTEEFANHLKFD